MWSHSIRLYLCWQWLTLKRYCRIQEPSHFHRAGLIFPIYIRPKRTEWIAKSGQCVRAVRPIDRLVHITVASVNVVFGEVLIEIWIPSAPLIVSLICYFCRRMDHHCPWINNCVGERNQKYFLQFLVYVGLLAIYSVALIVGSWVYPCETCSPDLPETQTRM